MKTKIIITAIAILMVFSTSLQAKKISGISKHTDSKYTIEKLDNPIRFNGHQIETWILTYQGEATPALVGIEKRGKEKYFHIRYGFMEITYKCSKEGFKVEKGDAKFTTIDPDAYMAIIDKQAFEKQALICNKQRSCRRLMKLIAKNIPFLPFQAKDNLAQSDL